METRENKSELLVALHNAVVCMEMVLSQMKLENEDDLNIFSLRKDMGLLKELTSNINQKEKNIVENILKDFNDETYNQGWESVKCWTDKRGKYKCLSNHNYDLSIKVLNDFAEKLQEKYLSDFDYKNDLILKGR